MRALLAAALLFAISASGTCAFVNNIGSPTRALCHGTTSELMATNSDDEIVSRRRALSSFLAGAAAVTSGLVAPTEASADGSRTIGQISGSGLVFKDTLVVEAFDDPKVKGVTLYVSNFERPLTGTFV